MRAALLCVALLGGCLDKAANDCGGGITCPADKRCVPGGGCALPEQFAACEGHDEGSSCVFTGGVGTCMGGVCVGSLCGNGAVDSGEVCDDGQSASECFEGGCRADCLEIERCGDGVVDCGEQCDDGNSNPADGCDACKLTMWSASAPIGGNASATSIGLDRPSKVAVDRYRNVYIADSGSHRVRRVDATGVITTIAGTGTACPDPTMRCGDGDVATSAQLNSPGGIAVDGLGNVFIADTSDHRIRRVDLNGIITTIAGTGVAGFSGDGGPATSARLYGPIGLAVDGLGTIYFVDYNVDRIRKIDLAGVITTFAGNGTYGFAGDGGPATAASFYDPTDVALDAVGNVYIADTSNSRIRRVDVTGVISTIAGSWPPGFSGDGGPATSAQLSMPSAVAVDASGDVYIADWNNYRVRRVETNGIITTVAGNGYQGFTGDGGPATNAELAGPLGIAVDSASQIYIADTGVDLGTGRPVSSRIRRIDTAGVITTIAGTAVSGFDGDGGAATSAPVGALYGVAVDALGNIYFADPDNNSVRRVDAAGVITTVAGNGVACAGANCGDGGPATQAQLAGPTMLALDGVGNLYIADTLDDCVRRVDASTGMITTVAGILDGSGGLGGGFSGDGGPATSAQLSVPVGVAIDASGNLYISDTGNARVRRVDASGVITTVAGIGVCISVNGCSVYFSGDGGPAIDAQLAGPGGMAVDTAGNVFFVDNQRIRRIDTAGIITTVAGSGSCSPNCVGGYSGDGGPATSAQLDSPTAVAVDGSGQIYIADYSNYRVRRVDATGIITTIAGSGPTGQYSCGGFEGDGGAAASALLASCAAPALGLGVAVDAGGNVYIGDGPNHRVRRVGTGGLITTIAGQIDPEGMGPVGQAHLADPRALVVTGPWSIAAGGTSGTVQIGHADSGWLEATIGRYPQNFPTGSLARYRDAGFGEISGIAYDDAARRLYLSETSANRVWMIDVVDPTDKNTWTIARLAGDGTSGFADGPATSARFWQPTGLYLDANAQVLYVADTGNHVIRAIDLATSSVTTVAGTPQTLGFFGDGQAATAALLYQPHALTRCPNGDFFIADTGNDRVRRIDATGTISTVLGVGVAASSGDGMPARAFPVDTPLGVACDAYGNVFVTSRNTVRLVAADDQHVVDGSGPVAAIYGVPPRTMFPASVTNCLTGISVVDAATVRMTDSCTGLLVELHRDFR